VERLIECLWHEAYPCDAWLSIDDVFALFSTHNAFYPEATCLDGFQLSFLRNQSQ
jgi:hypothetical protein